MGEGCVKWVEWTFTKGGEIEWERKGGVLCVCHLDAEEVDNASPTFFLRLSFFRGKKTDEAR